MDPKICFFSELGGRGGYPIFEIWVKEPGFGGLGSIVKEWFFWHDFGVQKKVLFVQKKVPWIRGIIPLKILAKRIIPFENPIIPKVKRIIPFENPKIPKVKRIIPFENPKIPKVKRIILFENPIIPKVKRMIPLI